MCGAPGGGGRRADRHLYQPPLLSPSVPPSLSWGSSRRGSSWPRPAARTSSSGPGPLPHTWDHPGLPNLINTTSTGAGAGPLFGPQGFVQLVAFGFGRSGAGGSSSLAQAITRT